MKTYLLFVACAVLAACTVVLAVPAADVLVASAAVRHE